MITSKIENLIGGGFVLVDHSSKHYQGRKEKKLKEVTEQSGNAYTFPEGMLKDKSLKI